jgi:transposase
VEAQPQYVGVDLHRRRSVIVRKDAAGKPLETVQIVNDPLALAEVIARAGDAPEVVLEATYGWYWAADVLADIGASVHLAHPLGNNWGNRRVKNERDAADLVDLLRLGRLAEAHIAPPGQRELRELVRHRAKMVAIRSGLKAQVHAVLAKQGIAVGVADLFGRAGRSLLEAAPLDEAYRLRVDSLVSLIEAFDGEVDHFEGLVADVLAGHPGYGNESRARCSGAALCAGQVRVIPADSGVASLERLSTGAGRTTSSLGRSL